MLCYLFSWRTWWVSEIPLASLIVSFFVCWLWSSAIFLQRSNWRRPRSRSFYLQPRCLIRLKTSLTHANRQALIAGSFSDIAPAFTRFSSPSDWRSKNQAWRCCWQVETIDMRDDDVWGLSTLNPLLKLVAFCALCALPATLAAPAGSCTHSQSVFQKRQRSDWFWRFYFTTQEGLGSATQFQQT